MQAQYSNKGQKELHEWLWRQRKTRSDLSKEIGSTYSQVWIWASGKGIPGLKHAAAIEIMTKGKVKCTMWLEPVKSKKRS